MHNEVERQERLAAQLLPQVRLRVPLELARHRVRLEIVQRLVDGVERRVPTMVRAERRVACAAAAAQRDLAL